MATIIETLEKNRDKYERDLSSSSTAFARNTDPTAKDLSTSSQLASINRQIESLKSQETRNRWYGARDTQADLPGESKGVLMRALEGLQKPLNVIAGTAQYALGKGPESSLVANINEAQRKGLTFGDILKQSGASRGVQVPLGFALDVMFDPINWLTMGTAALIPRIGTGLLRGGLKGAGVAGALRAARTGLTSGVYRKTAIGMRLVPFAKASEKYSAALSRISKKAVTGAEEFDKLIGTSTFDKLGRTPFGFQAGAIGKKIEEGIVKAFPKKGERIVEFFKYSPIKAAEVADLKDDVIRLGENKGLYLERDPLKADFRTIADFEKSGATIPGKMKTGFEKTINAADEVIQIRDPKTGFLKSNIGRIKVYDSLENAEQLLGARANDINTQHLLKEAYKVTPFGRTGFKWYDDVIDKFKNTTLGDLRHGRLGKAVLDDVASDADDLAKAYNSFGKVQDLKPFKRLLTAYPAYISIFKSAKVVMNASAHVVATLGNTIMGAMQGLPVYKPSFIREVWMANKMVRGKLGPSQLKAMFMTDVNSLMDMALNNPTRFRQLGLDSDEIQRMIRMGEKMKGSVRGEFSGLRQEFSKRLDDIERGLAQGEELGKIEKSVKGLDKTQETAISKKLGRFQTPSEIVEESAKRGQVYQTDLPGSFVSTEISQQSQWMEKVKRYFALAAENEPNNLLIRGMNSLVNSMPRWYEQIDQSWKIGTTNYLSKVGVNAQELMVISRSVKIDPVKDIVDTVIKNHEKLYKLSVLKAQEVAVETFMNYAAMPDFVKMMRAVPIAGFPFLSFPYAMASKTAKTAINNPAIFNKVSFIINEMNTGRTPQEKAAMETKYNQYLKSPTVMKMFGMWNTNVKNIVPYYTMNMFNPSERRYNEGFQSQMAKMTDKIPAFQDPVGQIFKDYFLQPWILTGSGQIPQGQFGQPLYPAYDEEGKKIDPKLRTKAFYAGRTVAESVVPGSFSYLGLLGRTLSPKAIDYIPSYGIRNLANATQGRSSIGALTKEHWAQKTLRSLLGRSGIPAYTLDVTKTRIKK